MNAEELTRPIIGIHNRTAQEVFDIMVDRIRGSALSTENTKPQGEGETHPAPVSHSVNPAGEGVRAHPEAEPQPEQHPLEEETTSTSAGARTAFLPGGRQAGKAHELQAHAGSSSVLPCVLSGEARLQAITSQAPSPHASQDTGMIPPGFGRAPVEPLRSPVVDRFLYPLETASDHAEETHHDAEEEAGWRKPSPISCKTKGVLEDYPTHSQQDGEVSDQTDPVSEHRSHARLFLHGADMRVDQSGSKSLEPSPQVPPPSTKMTEPDSAEARLREAALMGVAGSSIEFGRAADLGLLDASIRYRTDDEPLVTQARNSGEDHAPLVALFFHQIELCELLQAHLRKGSASLVLKLKPCIKSLAAADEDRGRRGQGSIGGDDVNLLKVTFCEDSCGAVTDLVMKPAHLCLPTHFQRYIVEAAHIVEGCANINSAPTRGIINNPSPHTNTTGPNVPLVNALVLQNALEMTGCDDEADLIDMANVGKSLMERVDSLVGMPGPYHGWSPADDPAEIVFDLVNDLDELREENAKLKAALEKRSSPSQTADLLWWQVEARSALATTGGSDNA